MPRTKTGDDASGNTYLKVRGMRKVHERGRKKSNVRINF